jgi:hypothetical protein
VQWKILRLTEQTSGAAYGATARPVEERLKTLFPELKSDSKPALVWFQDLEDGKTIQRCEGTIFQNENVGLAMKQFNCFKVDVRGMPGGELKDKYLKMSGFHFFDPAAEAACNPLIGRRATSLSAFQSSMERTWDQTFTMRLKDYTKKMKNILDDFDKIDSKKQVLDRKKAKLDKRPNPALQRAIEKEQAELDEAKKQVEEDEKAIFAECTLNEKYLPEKASDSE